MLTVKRISIPEVITKGFPLGSREVGFDARTSEYFIEVDEPDAGSRGVMGHRGIWYPIRLQPTDQVSQDSRTK